MGYRGASAAAGSPHCQHQPEGRGGPRRSARAGPLPTIHPTICPARPSQIFPVKPPPRPTPSCPPAPCPARPRTRPWTRTHARPVKPPPRPSQMVPVKPPPRPSQIRAWPVKLGEVSFNSVNIFISGRTPPPPPLTQPSCDRPY